MCNRTNNKQIIDLIKIIWGVKKLLITNNTDNLAQMCYETTLKMCQFSTNTKVSTVAGFDCIYITDITNVLDLFAHWHLLLAN